MRFLFVICAGSMLCATSAAQARDLEGLVSILNTVSYDDTGYMVGNPASRDFDRDGALRPCCGNPGFGDIGAPLRPGDLGYESGRGKDR